MWQVPDVWDDYGFSLSPDGSELIYTLGMAPRCTPDSQYIVFTGLSAQGNFDLILRNRDGSYRRELTDDPAVEWFCEISPQGDKVAYGKCITDPFPLDLCVLDITYASVRETTWGQIKRLFREGSLSRYAEPDCTSQSQDVRLVGLPGS